MKTKIQFINHASVIIECGADRILCDPWYESTIFNKGWNLIVENDPLTIEGKLKEVNYIWISHEHPDHFSIPFFKKYKKFIVDRSITILFQETIDQRVVSYLRNSGFSVQEIPLNVVWLLNNKLEILIIKDGFYDSGLLVKFDGEKILNLNDCEINSLGRANEVFQLTGHVDILLTQFSYAAWKGGRANRLWRSNAAIEKLNAVKLQVSIFMPKFLIPFASFSYFSNVENSYLNDCVNTTDDVVRQFKSCSTQVVVLKPYDVLDESRSKEQSDEANRYWLEKRDLIENKERNKFPIIDISRLEGEFVQYLERVNKCNNRFFMQCLRLCFPLNMIQPVYIQLNDHGCIVVVDVLARLLKTTKAEPHLSMSSASLSFIFTNTFGYDTLMVNGCFEECRKGGFARATKTLAIESLNNIGLKLSFGIIFNTIILKAVFSKIHSVGKKMYKYHQV
jgi:UDP-MurNAc hydroxylase